MNKKILVWTVGLSSAFAMGYGLRIATEESQTTTHQLTSNSASLLPTSAKLAINHPRDQDSSSSLATSDSQKMPVASPVNLDGIVEQIIEITSNGMQGFQFRDVVDLYTLVDSLKEEDLLNILETHFSGPDQRTDSVALLVLLGKYIEIDVRAALAFISSKVSDRKTKNAAMMSALNRWSQEDALSAYNFFIQQSELDNPEYSGTDSTMGLSTIFENLAILDLELAVDKLAEIGDADNQQFRALLGISSAMENKQDFLDFIKSTERLDNFELTESIVGAWSRKDPEEVADWLESEYQGDKTKELREQLFTSWFYKDRVKSADWFITSSTSSSLRENVNRILQTWAWEDPQTGLNWLSQHSSEIYNQTTFVTFLQHASYKNPDFVAARIELVNDPEKKVGLATRVHMSLSRQSTEKAQAYLANSPYRENIIK